MAIKIAFTSDTSNLEQGGKKAEKVISDVGATADDANKKTGGFGATLGSVGKIAGGFVLGSGLLKAPGALLDMAKGAAEDEQATARLNKTLENLAAVDNMLTFPELQAAVDNLIAKGGDLAFSDDEIRDSLQSLIAATGSADESMVRLAAAQDLARGANIPLATASKMLGKLNEENVEVFKKMGITLGENATEADALALVQQKFGGQADAYAQSTAGQFEVAQIKIAEAKEALGAQLLPVLTTVAGFMVGSVIPAIEGFVNNIGKIEPYLLPIGVAVGTMAAAIGIALIPSLVAWAVAQWAVAAPVIATYAPVIAIVAAIGLLAAGIVLLVQHWDQVTEKFPVLGVAADKVKAGLTVFKDFITGPFVDGLQALWDKFDFIFEAIKIVIETQFKAWMIIFQTGFDVIKGIIDVFAGIFTGDMDRVKEGVLKIFGALWEGAEKMFKLGIDALKNLAPLLLEGGKELGGALKDGFVAGVKGAIGVVGNLADALLDALKTLINSAIGAVNDAIPNDLKISVLGKDVGIDLPDNPIPALAAGGVVTKPTIALIGEAGPEAVIPLSSANARGGSLLGIGLGENVRPSGGGSSGRPTENLSLAELKSIKDHTAKAAAELENQEGFLAATSKALYSGSTKIADLVAQIAEALEVLPELWTFLRDIRDLVKNGQAPAFGNGAV